VLIANVIGLMEVGSADALAVAISGWIIVRYWRTLSLF